MNKEYFKSVSQGLFQQLDSKEHLSLEYRGEESFFLRFNRGKVRQNTAVNEGSLYLQLVANQRTISARVPLTGISSLDESNTKRMLSTLRQDIKSLPEDPFVVVPENYGSSNTIIEGKPLEHLNVAEAILAGGEPLDMTGIYAAGKIFRATANSAGTEHWFETENFNLDYSLISPSEKMAKGNYSGLHWNQKQFEANREMCEKQLKALERPVKKIKPGPYKTYLAPDAMAEVLGMMSYRGFSTQGLKQRQSPLLPLADGKAKLSTKLHLRENYTLGLDTPFNEAGELAPPTIDLLNRGELKNTLINRRSAKEFGLESNGAGIYEMLRSPEILPGTMSAEKALSELGTGLYLNQLHYLNWSELNAGRLTGMTRYACFWVENGEWAAPIENLRFDDSIYNLFGECLLDFTDTAETFAETRTYERRQLGGYKTPGAMISKMNFTL